MDEEVKIWAGKIALKILEIQGRKEFLKRIYRLAEKSVHDQEKLADFMEKEFFEH